MPKIYNDNSTYFRRVPTQFYKAGSNSRDTITIVGFFAVLYKGYNYVVVYYSIVGINTLANQTASRYAQEPKGTFVVLNKNGLGFLLVSYRILQYSKATVDLGQVRSNYKNPDNVFDQYQGQRAGEEIPRLVSIRIAADSATNSQTEFHIYKAKGRGDEGQVNVFYFKGLGAYAERARIKDTKLDGEGRVAEVVDRVQRQ